jgi:hypothetical protein
MITHFHQLHVKIIMLRVRLSHFFLHCHPWDLQRHHCKLCNAWMDNNPRSVRSHEEGNKHKENVANQMKKMRDERAAKDKVSPGALLTAVVHALLRSSSLTLPLRVRVFPPS